MPSDSERTEQLKKLCSVCFNLLLCELSFHTFPYTASVSYELAFYRVKSSLLKRTSTLS